MSARAREGESEGVPESAFVLLDLNLPRKTGFDFLTIVRSSEPLGHLRIVVFTSSVSPNDRAKCLALGANAYFSKPSTFDGYVSTLREILHLMEVQ